MKKYLMTSTLTIEVEDEDMGVMEALTCGAVNVTDSRMTMVSLDTGEIIASDLDLTEGLDLEKYKG